MAFYENGILQGSVAAVNTSAMPTTDNLYNLGAAGKRWKNLFIVPPTADPAVLGEVWARSFVNIDAVDSYVQAGGTLLVVSAG